MNRSLVERAAKAILSLKQFSGPVTARQEAVAIEYARAVLRLLTKEPHPDKARLDWLTRQPRTVYGDDVWVSLGSESVLQLPLRKAIDAAIKAERRVGKKGR